MAGGHPAFATSIGRELSCRLMIREGNLAEVDIIHCN